jgi:hypothetical protein
MTLRSTILALLIVALLVLAARFGVHITNSSVAAAGNSGRGSLETTSSDGTATPVLVELFTSEGCSSCPPADALLARLGRTQPVRSADIIVLEEHVDYWDRLGWKDPFSAAFATDRQNEYDQTFAGGQAYTPQMIVDGNFKFVGSSDSDALRAIRAASQTPKPAIQLSWAQDDTLTIHVEPQSDAAVHDGRELYLAVTESMLHSNVKHGENAGRALEHDGVVRQLRPVGKIAEASEGFSSSVVVHSAPEWNRANLRAVVFARDHRSLHVIAVAAIPFPPL